MVQYIPPPDPRNLLPPLLACLPTAFAAPRAPPALLPLLSPILRQRVQYLPCEASSSESWLPLLCWEKEPSQRLVDIVTESDAFELHPVSGEIDFGEVDSMRYRRLDEETLQTRVAIPSLQLVVVYLWCPGDQEGSGDGWQVSEVRPLDEKGLRDSISWSCTIAEADDTAKEQAMVDAMRQGEERSLGSGTVDGVPTVENVNEDDDDDYWAQYDNTPGRTPARTPGPKQSPLLDKGHARRTSEAEYYAQYAQVQPEMDNDDPSEDRDTIGASTLDGNVMADHGQYALNPSHAMDNHHAQLNGLMIDNNDGPSDRVLGQPSATTPPRIQRLEESADSQSVAEVAIKQHVSTSIKSMYRLCRSSGMDAAEFDEMVKVELSTLSMMTDDD